MSDVGLVPFKFFDQFLCQVVVESKDLALLPVFGIVAKDSKKTLSSMNGDVKSNIYFDRVRHFQFHALNWSSLNLSVLAREFNGDFTLANLK